MGPEEAVWTPLGDRPSTKRTIEDRFVLRFPMISALVYRVVWLLPWRSRLRRTVIRHGLEWGFQAYNRGDYEVLRSVYDPGVELITEPELVPLGFDPVYHGIEGWLSYAHRWNVEWGAYEARPEKFVDLGDGRLLVVGHQQARGSGSQAAADREMAILQTLARGRVVREEYFFDRDEALRAAGLAQ